MPYFDDHLGQVMGEFTGRPSDVVLGRKTYDIFSAYWPPASAAEGAQPLNDAASRSRPFLTWAGSSLLDGDVAEAVAALER